MNPKSLSFILNTIVSVGPKLKSWVFADGKFQPARALYLLLFFIALGVMAYVLGPEQTEVVVDMLDDVSDIVGYVE